MRTLSALEIKRRGVAAIEEALKDDGPVYVIKNNRPACVILSEDDYTSIIKQQKLEIATLWNILDNRPWQGQRSKKNIDKQMHQERDSWD